MPLLRNLAILVIIASTVASAQSSPSTVTSKMFSRASLSVPDSTVLEITRAQKADYPKAAKRERIQGEVVVKVLVSETGDVENAEILTGDPVLANAAIAAAKKFKFNPPVRNDGVVKAVTTLIFDFYFRDMMMTPEVDFQAGTTPAQEAVSKTRTRQANLGADATAGMLIRKINPVYPKAAKQKRIQGTVVLQAVIGKDGRIRDLRVISGPSELTQAAVGAVQQWQYRPYVLRGDIVEVDTQVAVKFELK